MPKHISIKIILAGLFFVLMVPLFFSTILIDTGNIQRFFFGLSATVLSLIILFVKNKQLRVNKHFILLSLLFLLSMVLSSLLTGSLALALVDLAFYVNCLGFAFLVIVLNQYDEDFLFHSSLFISIAAGLVVAIGILQALGINFFSMPTVRLPGSTLADRPFAAEYVIAAFPWLFIAFSYFKKRWLKLLWLFLALLVVYYIFLLRSRTAYVALFGCIVFFGFLYMVYHQRLAEFRRSLPYMVLGIMMLITGIFLSTISFHKLSRSSLTETVQQIYDPTNERIAFWHTTIDMISDKPLLGTGANGWSGVYPIYHGQYYNDANIYDSYINPHNDPLEIFAENGVFAFLAFLSLIGFGLFYLIRASKEDIRMLLLSTSFIGIFIVSLLSFTKDRAAPMILFYLAIGLSTMLAQKDSTYWRIDTRLLNPLLLILLALNLAFISLHLRYQYRYVEAMTHKFAERYDKMLVLMNQIDLRILAVDFNQTPITYYMGVGYFQKKEYETALENFTAALKLRPGIPTLQHNLGSTYYTLGKVEQAEAVFQELAKRFPNYIEPQINLVSIYANEGRHEAAIELIKSIESKFVGYGRVNGILHNDWSHYDSFVNKILNNYIYNELKAFYAHGFADKFLSAGLIKYPDSGKVYLLENGKKRMFMSEKSFEDRGHRWEDVIILPPNLTYPTGAPIAD